MDVKELFRTQLFYTVYNARRGGWSALQPLFEHQEERRATPTRCCWTEDACCCSPPIWKAATEAWTSTSPYWNEQTERWSDPRKPRLDGQHRRRRDIPSIIEDELYFASNGQEGYGGYDIYRVNFVEGKIMSNSLWHLPYPINSVYNDYGMMFHDGQGISFRIAGASSSATTSIRSRTPAPRFRDWRRSASRGNISPERRPDAGDEPGTRRRRPDGRQPDREYDPHATRRGRDPAHALLRFRPLGTPGAGAEELRALAADPVIGTLSEVIVVGYADEMGAEGYNQRLSEQRARAAAEELVRCGMKPRIVWEGRGRTAPDAEDYRAQMEERRLEPVRRMEPRDAHDRTAPARAHRTEPHGPPRGHHRQKTIIREK